jgi:hypothetical protein
MNSAIEKHDLGRVKTVRPFMAVLLSVPSWHICDLRKLSCHTTLAPRQRFLPEPFNEVAKYTLQFAMGVFVKGGGNCENSNAGCQ